MDVHKTYDAILIQPFNLVISGATSSGKNEWCYRLIANASEMISPPVDLIYFCYKVYQEKFKTLKGVQFFEGFDPLIVSKQQLKGKRVLLILDDLMMSIKPDVLLDLFTVQSHHAGVNPVFICHNLYYSNQKSARTVNLNTTYNCILKNPRDKSSINCLGSQMFPGESKYFLESYSIATKDSFSYLWIDSKPNQDEKLRLRTRIFPGEDQVCFVSNKSDRL